MTSEEKRSVDSVDEVCRVCGSQTEELFRCDTDIALLSNATPVPGSTFVNLCGVCAHAQTRPLMDLGKYYSSAYQFRMRSEDEDDLYDRVDGKNIYRSGHQATVAEMKIDFSQPMNVIDYGCGKAMSLKSLAERHPNIRPFTFDVSDSYRKSWNAFVPSDQQASFSVPDGWLGRMDVVLSFFALEHVEDPHGFVTELRSLLKPNGQLFVVIPNMINNISDLLVVDHVSHFSAPSLTNLLESEGFVDVTIDLEAFRGAFVVRAVKATSRKSAPTARASDKEIAVVRDVANFWQNAIERIREAESRQTDGQIAIYGSGIYGQFIASILTDRKKVACFLDQNPFRQGLSYMDIPVVAPAEIPVDVRLVLVGLNPVLARKAISGVESLHETPREFFYL